MRILILVLLGLITVGCNGSATKDGESGHKAKSEAKTDGQVKSDLPLDKLAFEILQNNDESKLWQITLSPEQEEKWRATATMPLDDGMSERSIRNAKEGLKLVHKETAAIGFDWSKATLVASRSTGMKIGTKVRAYTPDVDDLAELVLEIESEGTTIGVHMDDCFILEPGVHLMGDGFRYIKPQN